jgi:hypothetical protein
MIFPAYFILYYHIFPLDVLQEDRENFSQISSCDGREGGAQRLVVRVNSIKRTGARIAANISRALLPNVVLNKAGLGLS